MGRLAQDVTAALQAGNYGEDSDTLRVAADLMAKARGGEYRSGFADVDAEDITAEENAALKQATCQALERETDLRRRAALVWALDKSGDPAYHDIYLYCLRAFVEAALAGNAGIHQTLLALEASGAVGMERDAQGSVSPDIADAAENLRQARAYLRRHNILAPW